MRNPIQVLCGILLLLGCSTTPHYHPLLEDPESYHQAVQALSDVIVHDIFSPPVASRIYAYAAIAGYEVLASGDSSCRSLSNRLNDLKIEDRSLTTDVDLRLAAIHAHYEVGSRLVFSQDSLKTRRDQFYGQLEDAGLPPQIKTASIEFGRKVANEIMEWANTDQYLETRTNPKYTVKNDHSWQPTPPDYMEGIEPSWRKIRTMVLQNADQFVPAPPDPFDLSEGSAFYQQVLEVYEVGRNPSEAEMSIARFWDCNPYASYHQGHAMFAAKKITPGGHWVGITSIACRQSNRNMMESALAYAKVTIGLFDAFISCWDEKWRSVVIRPETVINAEIDPEWKPLLQTPPFPEYTSGHSVISRAAAVVLTDLFGPSYHFSDTVEVIYGLPAREFDSFLEASEEAAISRLYGGIHYRMAIEEGVNQGEQVGDWIVQKLQER